MIATLLGVLLLLLVLQDSFEAMVLPRRITRRWRATRFYYRSVWTLWRRAAELLPTGRYRENAYSIFGPLSLLGLFTAWAVSLITAFALIQWGSGNLPAPLGSHFWQCWYHSGETFFTLGYGDVTPTNYPGKLLAVLEAGMGFGFMAIVIGYLPVLYQAFSRREQMIALLDARAGSPPTAGEFLRRAGHPQLSSELDHFFSEWEVWAADLLESHLSYPVLGFYRSQHDNQSWLATLAVILDTSAVVLATANQKCQRRAQLTFAMARHACVDLCLVFWQPPIEVLPERLQPAEFEKLFPPDAYTAEVSAQTLERLRQMRELYEPYLQALSNYFSQRLPRFYPDRQVPDNWQTSAWSKRAPGITELSTGESQPDKHFSSG